MYRKNETLKNCNTNIQYCLNFRHNDKSDLHRNNLESWKREHSGQSSQNSFQPQRYRDRAKERRQKYGVDDEGPRPNRLKVRFATINRFNCLIVK